MASKLGRHYGIPKKNVEFFLLATSTAGNARMRTFSGKRLATSLEEDRIGEETRSLGQELLGELQDAGS